MKIAIQIAGYLRRYKELIDNFNEKIVDFNRKNGHEIDIFISTYDELDSVNSFSYKEGQNRPGDSAFDILDVRDKFNPKGLLVDGFSDVKHLFHINEYSDININEIQPNLHNNGIMFGLSMHFHRYISNILRQNYEKQNNIKYDMVLLMRADILWLDHLDFSKLDGEKLWAREKYYDYFFISKPKNIDKMCNVWLNIKNIAEKYGNNPHKGFGPFSPEYFLENHLLNLGVKDEDRGCISEGSSVLYPRKDFWPILNFVLNKYYSNNKVEKIQEISKYNLVNYD